MDKIIDVPKVRPGFGAFDMTAPLLAKLNPEGKWESSMPNNVDEAKLRAIVKYLIDTETVSAAQSYCSHCIAGNKAIHGKSCYIPVIVMPTYTTDNIPMDLNTSEESSSKRKKSNKAEKEETSQKSDEKEKKKQKKQFVMQRLTDFDLLSQW